MSNLNPALLERLLNAACLAPSSHNTQPWRFSWDNEQLLLFADFSKALADNDPDNRELLISCGCALFNIKVAAAAEGMSTEVRYLPDPDQPELLAAITLLKSTAALPLATFSPYLAKRFTHRAKFLPNNLADTVLPELSRLVAAQHAQLIQLAPEQISQLTIWVAQGDQQQWARTTWRAELASWLKPASTGEGLTLPGVIQPFASWLIRRANLGKMVANSNRQLCLNSAVVCLLCTQNDKARDWLGAGEALQQLLLQAAVYGLQASYLNQPLQEPNLRQRVSQLFGNQAPQMLIRLGYPATKATARIRRRPHFTTSSGD